MQTVTKQEYDNKTNLVQKYYSEYRDAAIIIQESQEEWLYPLLKKFGEMTLSNLNIERTDEAVSTVGACFLELINHINPKLHL